MGGGGTGTCRVRDKGPNGHMRKELPREEKVRPSVQNERAWVDGKKSKLTL